MVDLKKFGELCLAHAQGGADGADPTGGGLGGCEGFDWWDTEPVEYRIEVVRRW